VLSLGFLSTFLPFLPSLHYAVIFDTLFFPFHFFIKRHGDEWLDDGGGVASSARLGTSDLQWGPRWLIDLERIFIGLGMGEIAGDSSGSFLALNIPP